MLAGCASTTRGTGRDADVAPDAPESVVDAGDGWRVVTRERSLAVPCAGDRWCWEHPLPQGEAIVAARVLDDGVVWAVGPAGTALRYDGRAWTTSAPPTRDDLVGVWGLRDDDVWVVSARVVSNALMRRDLWRWNGASWRAVAVPSGLDPAAVDGVSAREVWILAIPPGRSTTTVWRYDGATFARADDGLPPSVAIATLWVESPGRVWAIGGAAGGAHSTDVYRRDAGRWARVGPLPDGLVLQGKIGGAAGEVYAHGVGILLSRDRALVRFDGDRLLREDAPVARGTFDDGVASGHGALWFTGESLARRVGGGWRPVDVVTGDGAVGVRPITRFAPDLAGGGFGFDVYGDLYQSESPTRVTLRSSPWRPRLASLVGRGAAPLGALTVIDGALQPRDARGVWGRPGDGGDVRALAVDDAQRPVFALRSDGVLARADGDRAAVSDLADHVVSVSARGGAAWAVTSRSALRFDGARFVTAATLPPRLDDLDVSMVTLREVWSEGDHAWAAGGYRLDTEIPSNIAVLCDATSTALRCATVPTATGTLGSMWSRSAAEPLWALRDGQLATIDRATLAVTPVGLALSHAGRALTLSTLRGNDRTGALVAFAAGQPAVAVRIEPAQRIATLLPVPLSQWAGWLRDVYLGDGGEVWAASEASQVIRYAP